MFMLRIALALQCIGMGLSAYHEPTALGTYLFLNTEISEKTTLLLDQVLGAILGLAGLLLFFRWVACALLFAGTVVFVLSVLSARFGGGALSEMAVIAASARFGAPLCAWFLVFGPARHWQAAAVGLRVAIALTFFAHGIEAMAWHPQFIDFIIVASQRLAGWSATQAFAQQCLLVIGAGDIFCAVVIWHKRQVGVLSYMAFWGLVTALARIVYAPNLWGVEEALMRSAHWGIPIWLIFWNLGSSQAATRVGDPLKNRENTYEPSA